MGNELPFFADSSVVGDYKPLKKYWVLLREKGLDIDKAVLTQEDFKYLEKIVEETGSIDLASLLDKLTDYFIDRIDCETALEAYRDTYGYVIDREEACRNMARIMAGWLIEAGKFLGIIKTRYGWRK